MEGRSTCNCGGRVRRIKTLSVVRDLPYATERLEICRCERCGKIYKIRWQWDAGTGCDDIWLSPGEKKRGYSFSMREYKEIQKELEQDKGNDKE